MRSKYFTSDDRLLSANENITIDTYIDTSFDKVIDKVEMVQNYTEHGKLFRKANEDYVSS